MGKVITTKMIVALLMSLAPEELINFRETEDGGAMAIAPTGAKYKFTAEELAAKEFTLSRGRSSTGPAKEIETEAPGLPADPVSKMETKKRQPVVKSVSKKGKGGSATHPIKK